MSIDASTSAVNSAAVLRSVCDEAASHHTNLLLVFHQAHIVRVIKTQLERLNCKIDTAQNAEQALEMVHAEKYDAVVIDAALPGMGCAQLCININRQLQCEKPRLFLAGSSADERAAQQTDWPTHAQSLGWPVSVTALLNVMAEPNSATNTLAFAESKVSNQR